MTRHVGFITTSWPTRRRPWAGHFISGLAKALVDSGIAVTVVAPCFLDDGKLEGREGVEVKGAPVACERGRGLAENWRTWSRVLWSLSRASRAVQVDRWLAHWWPTTLALPLAAPVVSVLHGSDMDLLERLPRFVAHSLARRGSVVAVAPGLADRFAARVGSRCPRPAVCPLGAERATSDEDIPHFAASWARESKPRVLTVARPARGKGTTVARQVAGLNVDMSYLVVGDPPVSPAQVRALLKHADLCVIPSREGPGLPSEGRPHIIAQALVAGVPCLGGPNSAVRQAMIEFGQMECAHSGADALTGAIRCALEADRYRALRKAAQEAGEGLTWGAASERWMRELY